ncbi:MAG TPA: CoA transferase, partial [Pseudomonadales bacterium]|nr:CoA transferase [Pseudomonadales bacterium]
MAKGPLNGVRILDLTHVWAGPLATRILADLGADVVKIEAPTSRGPRSYGRTTPLGGWIGGAPGDEPYNVNAVFVKLQRNKKSVAVDLKTSVGRTTFLELVKNADVVMENFSARAMPSLHLDYPVLSAANPKIIYVSMPGYGMDGPYRNRVAFGPSVEPLSGLTNVMGYGPDEPRNTAMALPDPIAALNATSAVVTALRRRQQTGRGALVEMSLHEGAAAFCGPWLIEHQLGEPVKRFGNRHPNMAPCGIYRCAGSDDWVAIACRDDRDWYAICATIPGSLDATADLEERVQTHHNIDQLIETWTLRHSKTAAADILQEANIPAGPVNTTPDMTSDSQTIARNFFVSIERGPTPIPGNPIKMKGISSADWTPCPRLGADNHEILREWLGYSRSEE